MTAQSRKNVVITGSTRGIGKGMATEFLKRRHSVAIAGRTDDGVASALAELIPIAMAHGARVVGCACDVSRLADVEALWRHAASSLGPIDIWINNAGRTNRSRKIAEIPAEETLSVVDTNLVGSMNGCSVALRNMREQGHGAIYNFEGFGSNGMHNSGSHIYGSTKYAITYFTKALIEETKGGPVLVGYMSPGMVTTDLLIGNRHRLPPQAWEGMKKIFNILADRVETVTPWLVERVLANERHGARIAWLTRKKSAWRFLKSRFVKRDLFGDERRRPAQG